MEGDDDDMDEEEGILEVVYSKEPPTKNARYMGGVRTNVQSILRRPVVSKPVKFEQSPEPEDDAEEGEEDEDRE